MNKLFHGVDVNQLLKIQGRKGYGVSLALAKGEELETFCSGSGRFGQDFPVNPDMLSGRLHFEAHVRHDGAAVCGQGDH